MPAGTTVDFGRCYNLADRGIIQMIDSGTTEEIQFGSYLVYDQVCRVHKGPSVTPHEAAHLVASTSETELIAMRLLANNTVSWLGTKLNLSDVSPLPQYICDTG